VGFFEEICSICPELSPLESSQRLNTFETEIFDTFPEALQWDEWAQNALILEMYRRRYGRR
jgi:hypothetical protein